MKFARRFIFQTLMGTWSFYRTLSDNGVVKGGANFKETEPGILHYSETGQWQTQDKILQISKDYQYRYDSATDKITVYFLEQDKAGKIFHEIHVLAADQQRCKAQARGEHQCLADNYQVGYFFTGKNKFSLIYDVKGPAKNYISTTIFERVTSK